MRQVISTYEGIVEANVYGVQVPGQVCCQASLNCWIYIRVFACMHVCMYASVDARMDIWTNGRADDYGAYRGNLHDF